MFRSLAAICWTSEEPSCDDQVSTEISIKILADLDAQCLDVTCSNNHSARSGAKIVVVHDMAHSAGPRPMHCNVTQPCGWATVPMGSSRPRSRWRRRRSLVHVLIGIQQCWLPEWKLPWLLREGNKECQSKTDIGPACSLPPYSLPSSPAHHASFQISRRLGSIQKPGIILKHLRCITLTFWNAAL